MKRKPKIAFAYKGQFGGQLVHVEEVANGKACDCFCPACREPLVAVQGSSDRVWHFRHSADTECEASSAAETALHLALKKVLMSGSKIRLPTLFIEQAGYFEDVRETVTDRYCDQQVRYSNPREEVTYPGMRPDIVVQVGGKDLIIEIAVTHRVGRKKRDLIRDKGIAAIELHAHKLDRSANFATLRNFVQSSFKDRKWINNPRESEYEAEVRAKADTLAKREFEVRSAELRRRAAQAASERARASVAKHIATEEPAQPKATVVETPGFMAWIRTLLFGDRNHPAR